MDKSAKATTASDNYELKTFNRRALRPTREGARGVWVDMDGTALRIPEEWATLNLICNNPEHGNGKNNKLVRLTRVELAEPSTKSEGESWRLWWTGIFGDVPPTSIIDALGEHLWLPEGQPDTANWRARGEEKWRKTEVIEGVHIEKDDKHKWTGGNIGRIEKAGAAYATGDEWGHYYNTWNSGRTDSIKHFLETLEQALFMPEAMGRFHDSSAFFSVKPARILAPMENTKPSKGSLVHGVTILVPKEDKKDKLVIPPRADFRIKYECDRPECNAKGTINLASPEITGKLNKAAEEKKRAIKLTTLLLS
ncbi:MAG: hypothetical protein IKZ87_06060 [Actinomycetaceae bacterium]|nr:hypothetical protein [Actinomycetaceae bacterium]